MVGEYVEVYVRPLDPEWHGTMIELTNETHKEGEVAGSSKVILPADPNNAVELPLDYPAKP